MANTEKPVAGTTDDAEFSGSDADEAEFEVEPLVKPKGRGLSGAVAWAALLLAILALAAFGYDYVRDQGALGDSANSEAEIGRLTASLGATQDTVASLEASIAALTAELSTQTAAQDSGVAAVERQLNDRLRQLEALPGRLTAIEGSLAAVQGISTGARDAWLLAEAEYYMQIANAQLQLANNPTLAGIALRHADDRIQQLADPRLTAVRQALSDELRSLEVLQVPDTAGITLTLASLAGVVESLPLRQEAVVISGDEEQLANELTGMDRALATMKSVLGDSVKIRRADEAMQPLIAPEAQYFLRANLALKLQMARLAILRGEETEFQQSLAEASTWLTDYYDTSSSAVTSALQTITEIQGSTLSVATPDISRSLRLLRQFNTLNSAAPRDVADGPEQDQ